ncbi:hypothetical protein SapgrDRAFT_3008 [Saprospira grandis DSM 2844]|uniref:Uncharacterized protein n=1 Tax=Saprospira grandis DSM 2844 TaxID=694433 RepID=J0PAN0_9BACT|nr:hypothetical protein [Saprospira grandis]EJF54657.1 hypothetical protein SapgrDRAFT_3008 [Saprospira grandis DSM 2844]
MNKQRILQAGIITKTNSLAQAAPALQPHAVSLTLVLDQGKQRQQPFGQMNAHWASQAVKGRQR